MKIEGVIWARSVVDKLILKHKVTTYEVEEVLSFKPKIRFVEKGYTKGEDVYVALGKSIFSSTFYLQEKQRSAYLKCKRYGTKGAKAI